MTVRAGAALVLGGSGGIGRVISRELAQDGWDVALTWRGNQAGAEIASADVALAGRRALTLQADLAEAASAASAIKATLAEFGAIGTLVYAAGPLVPQLHISRMTPAQMQTHLAQDTMGFFHAVHAALPHLRASGGNLVACVSTAQFRYATQDALSVVPKAAVTALMTGIAKEEGRFGVRANGVAVGLIEAGQHLELQRLGQVDQAYLAAAAQATPLRRVGQPEDIAEAVCFLAANERAGFVTGQVIRVDGGYSI